MPTEHVGTLSSIWIQFQKLGGTAVHSFVHGATLALRGVSSCTCIDVACESQIALPAAFMRKECARSCNSCGWEDTYCSRRTAGPAKSEGGVNALFEHAAKQTEYEPTVHSTSPWVMTFGKFVSDEEAAFSVLASIALQGIRLAKPTLGESVGVVGLGLIGLLTVQMLKAAGCRALGVDLAPDRCEAARSFGVEGFEKNLHFSPVEHLGGTFCIKHT